MRKVALAISVLLPAGPAAQIPTSGNVFAGYSFNVSQNSVRFGTGIVVRF